jgi:hypothetical protein
VAQDRIDREIRAIRTAISRQLENARKEGRLSEALAEIDASGRKWLKGIREDVREALRSRKKHRPRGVTRATKRKRA